jgi:hypothetical protein
MPRTLSDAVEASLTQMLLAGETTLHIHQALGVARSTIVRRRQDYGIYTTDRTTLRTLTTPADRFEHYAVPANADGHREWTGLTDTSGTPFIKMGDRHISARRTAFRIAHGRDPIGQVRPTCGEPWCVAPAHQADQQQRDASRTACAPLTGQCRNSHDLALHGTRDNRGVATCRACDRDRKRAARGAAA